MVEAIGFVGLGQMGFEMASRLVGAGFSLRVWNRTRAHSERLAAASPNVNVCGSARQAANGTSIVVSSLADDRVVREVVLGDEGVAAGLAEGGIHVGASTISHALASELVELHARRGQMFVAAPVLGRPDAASRGELWVLTGGDRPAVARCQPIFEAISRGQIHLGGAAQAMLGKIIANMMIAGTIELLGEATALGEKGGLPAAEVVRLLTDTLFGSPVVRGYGSRIATGKYEPAGFRVALGLKDVELALAVGHELRVPLPVASVIRDHLIEALARGHDQWDWSGLAAIVREAAGLPSGNS